MSRNAKRTVWITCIVAGIASSVVLVSQGLENRALVRRLEDRREEIAVLRKGGQAKPLSVLQSASRSRSAAGEDSYAATAVAEEHIEDTRRRIEAFVEGFGHDLDPEALFRNLPDFLRIVQDLSASEMIEVASRIDHLPSGPASGMAMARKTLLLLAAEHDPMQVYERAGAGVLENLGIHRTVLGQLARRDFAEARSRVEDSDLTDDEKYRTISVLAAEVMRDNVGEGLELLREMGNYSGFSRPLPEERIPELVAALDDPANAAMRRDLVYMILDGTGLAGDLAAVREISEQIKATPEELSWHIMGYFKDGGSECEAAMAWMNEAFDDEVLARTVPEAIQSWAHRDYNGAGRYLGTMEPSEIRDRSIHRFSKTVTDIDPEAAAIWAAEIGQPGLRDQVVRAVTERWLEQDPVAAERWLEAYRREAGGEP